MFWVGGGGLTFFTGSGYERGWVEVGGYFLWVNGVEWGRMEVWNLWEIWIMFFYISFCNIVKVNHLLHRFVILLHLISSFSLTRSLLIPYAYVSIESFDCILLSSFELNAILLICSVKKLCLSILNLCCFFFYQLIVFYEFFVIFFKTIYANLICF